MTYYEKRSRKRILDLNIRTECEIEQTDRNYFLDTELPEERSTDLSRDALATAAPSSVSRWSESDHQIAESSEHTFILVRAMTRPLRDEPYWECLHLPAVLLIPKLVMLPRTGADNMKHVAVRFGAGIPRMPMENEANLSLSSYMGKTSEPCKVSSIMRPRNRWREWKGKTSFFSIAIHILSDALFDFSTSMRKKTKRLYISP